MKNILVTGGAGFIGSHTVVELHKAGYRPVIVDNFSHSYPFIIENIEKLIGGPVTLYDIDCKDKNGLRDIFRKEKINGVIHFAAYKSVGESEEIPLQYYENNVNSLLVALEVMKEFEVKNLVFSSSATVYGNPATNPVTEETEVKPALSVYGGTKLICEKILMDVSPVEPNFTACILRYFNPIGAHESGLLGELPLAKPNNLVPYITQVDTGLLEELTIFGDKYDTPDGSCIRDFIHVMDLAQAHVAAMDYAFENTPENGYEVFNLGTGKGTSVLELVNAYEEANDTKVPYKIGPNRQGDIVSLYANVAKAENVLKWKAKYSVHQALAFASQWQRNANAKLEELAQ